MYWRVCEEGTGEDLGLSFIRGTGLAQVLLTYGIISQNLFQIMLVSTIHVKSRQDRIKVLIKPKWVTAAIFSPPLIFQRK